jgi:hypothetical protein
MKQHRATFLGDTYFLSTTSLMLLGLGMGGIDVFLVLTVFLAFLGNGATQSTV